MANVMIRMTGGDFDRDKGLFEAALRQANLPAGEMPQVVRHARGVVNDSRNTGKRIPVTVRDYELTDADDRQRVSPHCHLQTTRKRDHLYYIVVDFVV